MFPGVTLHEMGFIYPRKRQQGSASLAQRGRDRYGTVLRGVYIALVKNVSMVPRSSCVVRRSDGATNRVIFLLRLLSLLPRPPLPRQIPQETEELSKSLWSFGGGMSTTID